MPKPATALSDAYVARLRAFDRTRVKLERLLSEGRVNRNDLALFYEGIFLRTVTSFEGLIEDLFVGLLAGSISPGRRVHPRITVASHVMARKIVLGGRPYVDWLPYDATKKRAKAFFRDGRPFSSLDKTDVGDLQRILTIRHALAHQSRSARAKFEKEVIGSAPLMQTERTPAGYLRSTFRVTPSRTRYEEIANTCADLARKLCG